MPLDTSKVKKYYDRFGSKQDSQGFYEDPPVAQLIAHADFASAKGIFEFGCGTGRLAYRLLSDYLPAESSYRGIDVSETMVALAEDRLASFGDRASVTQSAGGTKIDLEDRSVDRFVSAYVLDLLPDEGISDLFSEARRVLAPGGRFCGVSLGRGRSLGSKIVGGLWSAAFHISPMLVGGCRPISFSRHLAPGEWNVLFQETFSPYGVPSEVLVAEVTGRH